MKKIDIFDQYLASSHVVNAATVGCYQHVPPYRGKLVTLIAAKSKRRSLLMTEDGRQSVYDKKPQRYAKDNRTAFSSTQ